MGEQTEVKLEPTDLLTPEQLSERLKVSLNWVYEQTRARGRDGTKPLPFVKCGRYLRFIWPDVIEWLRQSRPESRQKAARNHS